LFTNHSAVSRDLTSIQESGFTNRPSGIPLVNVRQT
jgi:hypothetical protein